MRTFFNGMVLIYTQNFVEIVVSGAPYTGKPWSFGLTFLSSHGRANLVSTDTYTNSRSSVHNCFAAGVSMSWSI